MIPVISVLVIVLLSMVVTRIATIALTLTGMSREAARFQARSALTGAGFTTSESESVVTHPVRRRIVMMLMLVGSAGIVSVIAGVMLSFVRTTSTADAVRNLLLLVGGVGGLLALMRLRPVDRAVSRVIRRGLTRWTDLEVRDYAALLEIHGGYSVSELHVDDTDWLAGRTFSELRLNDEGVLVLGVQRRDGTYIGAPTGRTRVQPGDVPVVYGHGHRIAELDQRPTGPVGAEQHVAATVEQRTQQSPPDVPEPS